jgi:hypothetical protein
VNEKPPRQYAAEVYAVLEERDQAGTQFDKKRLQDKAQAMMDRVPEEIKTVVREYVADWRVRARNKRQLFGR